MSKNHSSRLRKVSGSVLLIVSALSLHLNAQNALGSPPSQHEQNRTEPPVTGVPKAGATFRTLAGQIAQSGRILEIGTPPADRLMENPQIPPGAAPILRFRVLEEQARFRLGRLDIVVDDAGH